MTKGRMGWSLIELTIILVVLAILSAILAPVMNRYVSNAKVVRAREDVQAIGSAIMMFIEDTGNSYFLQEGQSGGDTGASRNYDGGTGSAPNQHQNNRVNVLVSDGDIPEVNLVDSNSNWRQKVNRTTVDFFEYHLVSNAPGNGSFGYRTPPELDNDGGITSADDPMFARDESGGFNSEFAWRGPYITAPIDADPWGNRYAANVFALAPRADSQNDEVANDNVGGDTTDCIVLSAGPDEETDTAYYADGITPGDDDILYTVSGNAP